MKLTAIHLQNYRAHPDLHVNFTAGFNAVVGINGSGKTSLLKGIGDCFAGMLAGLPNVAWIAFEGNACVHVARVRTGERYRFEPQFPIQVSAKGVANGTEFDITVDKLSDTSHANLSGRSPLPGSHQAGTQAANAQTLPVLAVYLADRLWSATASDSITAALAKSSRHDGYRQWANAAVDGAALQYWVISKCLERYQRSSETGARFHEIKDDELALVNAALRAAIEEFEDLRYDMSQKSLLVNWRNGEGETGRTVAFDKLSDGQRAVVCLVADIARRICLLNPHLGTRVVRETPGVVLIDELEVHLHPRWQRRIVNGLKAAFPAVQFIVTSHSPQVIGELQPDEVILLREGETSRPQVSYGLDSSQVLEEIMGASSRNLEIDQKLKHLFVTLENGDLAEAKSQLAQLNEQAPDLPELSRAAALLRRKEMIGR